MIKRREEAKLGVTFLVWWFIWKERNHRIFYGRCLIANQVASMVSTSDLQIFGVGLEGIQVGEINLLTAA
jgi:hypothetical protein